MLVPSEDDVAAKEVPGLAGEITSAPFRVSGG